MTRNCIIAVWIILTSSGLSGCSTARGGQAEAGWITLLDGSNFEHWNQVGNANWRIADGAIVADKGSGHLVSKSSYGDLQIRAEFWGNDDANSGIHIRCADPQKPGSATCYEANIFDKRAEADYGTGAIVNVAKVLTMLKTGDRWNTMEITARGPHMSVTLNGVKTAEGQDSKFSRGPITIQYAGGVVKFRRLQIRPL